MFKKNSNSVQIYVKIAIFEIYPKLLDKSNSEKTHRKLESISLLWREIPFL